MKEKKREYVPDNSERFPVVYIIQSLNIETYFTLREICVFSLTGTIKHHAQRYGLTGADFVCRINGLHACIRKSKNEYEVKRNGYIEYAHLKNTDRYMIHSSNFTR